MPSLEISSDPIRVDIGVVHGFLTKTYWAAGRTAEQVQQSIEHSMPFSLFLDGQQIGFARVLSDRTAFAYFLDVFVLPSQRGNGYATMLLKHILASPELDCVQVWMLKTSDAHALYRQVGFGELQEVERLMALYRQLS